MSVTAAQGFVASGIHCGIKPSGRPDLALVATDDGQPVPAAAVFTSNLMAAAPVVVSRQHLSATDGRAAAVILNSGNANAATGEGGIAAATFMCDATAKALGTQPRDVLVCSTGLIGIPLITDPLVTGIPTLVGQRAAGAEAGVDAAEAICTTDTVRKEAVARATGDAFVVGGMAKGAAMLAPNMATMLAVITTDAVADPPMLQAALRAGVADSFNALTVDGCTSTNDTVILLASGRSGHEPNDGGAELAALVASVCADLAYQMAGDAEGATKVVRLEVTGAASDDDARQAGRKAAQSQLVKCSWYGEDPYWGRIASELGSAGVPFDPNRVSIAYGGVVVARNGVAVDHDREAVQKHMAERELSIVADLGIGSGSAVVLSNDLTHAYIDENRTTS